VNNATKVREGCKRQLMHVLFPAAVVTREELDGNLEEGQIREIPLEEKGKKVISDV